MSTENLPTAGTCIFDGKNTIHLHRLFLVGLTLVSFSTALYGQPRLVDSITTLLETENRPLERMDLLTGLCRAVTLAEGRETAVPYAQAALAYARKTKNIAGESYALVFLLESEIDQEKDGLQRALLALKLAKESNSPSFEIVAICYIIEHYIIDNTDLPNARKWIQEGRSRLQPSVSPRQRGSLYKDIGDYFEIIGHHDSSYYWFEAALHQFERVRDYQDPALGRAPTCRTTLQSSFGNRAKMERILSYRLVIKGIGRFVRCLGRYLNGH